MNAAKQAAWLFLTLLALAGSGWYFASSKPVVRLDDLTLSTTPDTLIRGLTVQQFNTRGEVSHYLQTPLMQHIPRENTHLLETPDIMIAQPGKPAWEIHARKATALHGGQQITFQNEVVIHQTNDQHQQETTINTSELVYFPQKQMATTQKDITLLQGNNTVQSTGMKANLATHHIRLLNNTRVDQKDSHLRANQIVTAGDERNRLVSAIIHGSQRTQAHYWTVSGAKKPIMHAYADTIYYDEKHHLIKLMGNARVEQGNDSFRAPEITYDTLAQHVVSQASDTERTTIIIHPGKQT
jgi:lipopolysaccharide export system protein LptC